MEFHTIAASMLLGDLLDTVNLYSNPHNGMYMVCVIDVLERLGVSTPALLIFFSDDEEDEHFFGFLTAGNMTTLGELTDVQEVIKIAKSQKDNVTSEELLASVIYFLDHDAFFNIPK